MRINAVDVEDRAWVHARMEHAESMESEAQAIEDDVRLTVAKLLAK